MAEKKRTLRVTQVKSAIACPADQGRTLKALGLCKIGIYLRKFFGVAPSVVGRHLHAQQQNLGACLLRCLHHGPEVLARSRQGQATQRIVSAQFNDHHLGLVLAQQSGQASAAARRRVSTDAGIGDAHRFTQGLQPLLQQCNPSGATCQPILCAE